MLVLSWWIHRLKLRVTYVIAFLQPDNLKSLRCWCQMQKCYKLSYLPVFFPHQCLCVRPFVWSRCLSLAACVHLNLPDHLFPACTRPHRATHRRTACLWWHTSLRGKVLLSDRRDRRFLELPVNPLCWSVLLGCSAPLGSHKHMCMLIIYLSIGWDHLKLLGSCDLVLNTKLKFQTQSTLSISIFQLLEFPPQWGQQWSSI